MSRFKLLDDQDDQKSSFTSTNVPKQKALPQSTAPSTIIPTPTHSKSTNRFLKPIAPHLEQHLTLGKSLNPSKADFESQTQHVTPKDPNNPLSTNSNVNAQFVDRLCHDMEQIWADNPHKPFQCTPFKRLLRSPEMRFCLENQLLPKRIIKALDQNILSQKVRNTVNFLSKGKVCAGKPGDIVFTPQQLSQLTCPEIDSDFETEANSDDVVEKKAATNNRSIHLNKSDRFAILAPKDDLVEKSPADDTASTSWANICMTTRDSQTQPQTKRTTNPSSTAPTRKIKAVCNDLGADDAIDYFLDRQRAKEESQRIKEARLAEQHFHHDIRREQQRFQSKNDRQNTQSDANPPPKTQQRLQSKNDRQNTQSDTNPPPKTQQNPTPSQQKSSQQPIQKSAGPVKTQDGWISRPGGLALDVNIPSHLSERQIRQRQSEFQRIHDHHRDTYGPTAVNNRHCQNLVDFLHFQHDLAHHLITFSGEHHIPAPSDSPNDTQPNLAPQLPPTTWSLNDLKYISLLLGKNRAHYLYAVKLRQRLQDGHYDAVHHEIDDEHGEIDSLLDEFYYNQQRINDVISSLAPHVQTIETTPSESKKTASENEQDDKYGVADKDFYNYIELLNAFPGIEEHEPMHILHDLDVPVSLYSLCSKSRYEDPSELDLAQSDDKETTKTSKASKPQQPQNDHDNSDVSSDNDNQLPVYSRGHNRYQQRSYLHPEAKPFVPHISHHSQHIQNQFGDQSYGQYQQHYSVPHYTPRDQSRTQNINYNRRGSRHSNAQNGYYHQYQYGNPNQQGYWSQGSGYNYPNYQSQQHGYNNPGYQNPQSSHWTQYQHHQQPSSQQQQQQPQPHQEDSYHHPHNRSMDPSQINQVKHIYHHHHHSHDSHNNTQQHSIPTSTVSDEEKVRRDDSIPLPTHTEVHTARDNVILIPVEEYHRLVQLSKHKTAPAADDDADEKSDQPSESKTSTAGKTFQANVSDIATKPSSDVTKVSAENASPSTISPQQRQQPALHPYPHPQQPHAYSPYQRQQHYARPYYYQDQDDRDFDHSGMVEQYHTQNAYPNYSHMNNQGYYYPTQYHHHQPGPRRASMDSIGSRGSRDQNYPNTSRISNHTMYPTQGHYYSLYQQPPQPNQQQQQYQQVPVNYQNRPVSGVSTTSSIGADGLSRKQRRKLWYKNYLDRHPHQKEQFLQTHYYKSSRATQKPNSTSQNDDTYDTDDSSQPHRRSSLCSIDNDNYYQDNEEFCIY